MTWLGNASTLVNSENKTIPIIIVTCLLINYEMLITDSYWFAVSENQSATSLQLAIEVKPCKIR